MRFAEFGNISADSVQVHILPNNAIRFAEFFWVDQVCYLPYPSGSYYLFVEEDA
ncbi:MAG: hypothetical protein UY19_C0007G0045 [Candidatus Wolfebacteria bacterium GW2011_GWA2_47_9b]|uniref:Uncharacterized protein n=2 Tax=Candidatus Wolfeibacteriota TaxID=1752735 RepID=A0A0G1U785_9BACT|nr:MAG: hypothetical protein UX70_C0001G0114 [Candidatus Wolfebacteria bacterium GW2011_GWB1_47_1]KKU89959.1 MAG: hypothetical protein UY19_C0007G0045 [Candidatus Wolfebacteria bacterium GW2011_GWA2_47_9b]